MSKLTYSSLKLKTVEDIKEISFDNSTIEIKQYLPIKDKYDLIVIAAQKAYENGLYNPVLLDMYFHLFLVYMYTNITFTDKQKEDELKLYDAFKSNGLLDSIINAIPEEEYDILFTQLDEYITVKTKYNNSFIGLFNEVISELPAQIKDASDIINNFDAEKLSNVMDFTKAINGNL